MFKQKRDSTAPTAPADAVQQARARARQRLIGAVVLLAIGIIGFPLVFETQPRPIPVDIPIEIPGKDAVPPLVAPPAPPDAQRSGSGAAPSGQSDGVITESRGEAGRDVTSPSPSVLAKPREVAPEQTASAAHAATASALSSAEEPSSSAAMHRAAAATAPRAAVQRAETSREDKEKARIEASRAEAARAKALLEGRSVAAASAARYVVQVGAFADAQAAREVRQKVEKLGLKTYTQVAQTSAGSRIRVRVGPFASRDEADAALAKARAAGLPAVVVTL